MKALISVFLVFFMLLMLCACSKPQTQPTTTTTAPTTASTGPVHRHSFLDADCTSPKTCADCGQTRGDALGHDYAGGFCTRCADPDSSYVVLTEGTWQTDCLSENGDTLEHLSLTFAADGSAKLSIRLYASLAGVDEDQWSQYPQESLYDYSGTPYYFTGTAKSRTLSYTVDGDVITCTVGTGSKISATLILERTSGSRLTVTFFEDDLGIENLQVGDVLSCSP